MSARRRHRTAAERSPDRARPDHAGGDRREPARPALDRSSPL